MVKFLLLAAVLAGSSTCLSDPLPDEAALRETYFAPITTSGLWRMRMEDGAIREFESTGAANEFRSVDGWRARVRRERATVTSGPRVHPARKYEFEYGTLKRFSSDGVTVCPDDRKPVVYENETICPLWPEPDEVSPENRRIAGTWEKDGKRLKLWFESPNQAGAFLSLLLLAGVVAILFPPRRWIRWAGVVWTLAMLVPLVRTDSRGAVVATLVASATLFVCFWTRRRRLTGRVLLAGVLSLVLLIGGALAGQKLLSSRAGSYAKSNDIRLQVWKAAPRMMCDAPWGWGPGLLGAGRAYSSWYVPLTAQYRQASLINDHLTVLVSWGWLRGGLYLLLWFGGLWFLWSLAFRGGFPLVAAWATSLGIAAFFNIVLFEPLLHWTLAASLLLLVFDRRRMTVRLWMVSAAAGLLCASGVLLLLAGFGRMARTEFLSVHRDGTVVSVNGRDPKVCVVDDLETIGAHQATWELRQFYSIVPNGASVAYATDLDSALARRGLRRLAVAGKRGLELLERFEEDPARCRLPAEIVFLSPPFAPSEAPAALIGKVRTMFVYGEFAARYYSELSVPMPGVKIVKGAEIYLPGWICHCLTGIDRQ